MPATAPPAPAPVTALTPKLSSPEIEGLIKRYLDAWNRRDLDGVLACLHPNIVWEDYDGRKSQGRGSAWTAWQPQFQFNGEIRLEIEDLIVDLERQRAVLRWTFRQIASMRATAGLQPPQHRQRGIELLRFGDGRITERLVYVKAARALWE